MEYKRREVSKEPRINDGIRATTVRVINEEGEMLGILPIKEALFLAHSKKLDLIEVNTEASPPVCKIVDYGKMRYQAQKKKSLMKKNQHTVEIKELQLRPGIAQNDYQVKLSNAKRFLEKGNKVKIVLQFRGREITHQDIGKKVVEDMLEALSDFGKPESPMKAEAKKLIVTVAPIKKQLEQPSQQDPA